MPEAAQNLLPIIISDTRAKITIGEGLYTCENHLLQGTGITEVQFKADEHCKIKGHLNDGNIHNIIDDGEVKDSQLIEGTRYMYVRESEKEEKTLLHIHKGRFINGRLDGKNCSITSFTTATKFGIGYLLAEGQVDNVTKIITKGLFKDGKQVSGDVTLYGQDNKVICKISADLFYLQRDKQGEETLRYRNGTKILYHEKEGVKQITIEERKNGKIESTTTTIESEKHQIARKKLEKELIVRWTQSFGPLISNSCVVFG